MLLIALPLALAGCGNKGPLVMPEPAVEEAPAADTDADAVPVEVDVPETLPADEPEGALPDPTAADPLLDDTGGTDPMPAPVDPAPDTAGEPATDADPTDPATTGDDGADPDGNG
ncbi:hypothetical protein N799_04850 [Lysobacter arseniciresistens ZS79]|uniref:Sugar transporter n=1 Tax=Lysobacter arseniciresistens ZS79 TaxID=913325 RepID=A0A0A0F4Y8_9GAMM|nr:hypothetical protein N799_04850 [Lysobacter arseniciresistens ZS79]